MHSGIKKWHQSLESDAGILNSMNSAYEQRFRISIIFLFAQIKDLSFPPIPGFHLDQFVQAWITHLSTATKQTLRTGKALTSFVHTAVSIIDYTTAQG